MIDVLFLTLADTVSVLVMTMLFRYVFGAELKLGLKRIFVIAGIYFGVSMTEKIVTGGQFSFVLVLLALFLIYMVTCSGKRRYFWLYFIPMLLLYNSVSLYMSLLDRTFGTGDFFWRNTDVFQLVFLVVWAVWSERNKITFHMNVVESIFIGFYAFMGSFYGEVSRMIEIGVLPEKNPFIYQFLWTMFVTTVHISVICFFVYRKKHLYAKRISEMYKKYFEEEYKGFCEKINRQNEMDRMRHDWKNHVNTVQNLWERGRKEQAVEYVAGLAVEEVVSFSVLSGCEVADVILNLKQKSAMESGISYEFTGSLESMCYMEPVDICVLLGNALDNALEGCCRGGSISISAAGNKGMLMLTIENTLAKKVVMKNNRPVTDKKNPAMHGFGVLGMEHVVQKYKGELKFEVTKDAFKVQAILPVE